MTTTDFYPPRDMSKSKLYRINTLAGLNPREETEQSPHGKNWEGAPDAGLGVTGRSAPREDLNACPGCGGDADNGHDRCVPPSPYFCKSCSTNDLLIEAQISSSGALK